MKFLPWHRGCFRNKFSVDSPNYFDQQRRDSSTCFENSGVIDNDCHVNHETVSTNDDALLIVQDLLSLTMTFVFQESKGQFEFIFNLPPSKI